LKGLQKDIKFQRIPSHFGVVGNEMADYLAKKGTVIIQMFTCKLSFHSAKLKKKKAFTLISQDITPFKANTNPGTK
jgi:ribonuclease HI